LIYLVKKFGHLAKSVYYTKLVKKLRSLTHSKQHLGHFKLFCIVPVADSATQSGPRGGFRHGATKMAASAPISSQAKIVTAKLENLKFTNKNEFVKKNKYAPCRVAMCE
jgi:hypothetical protein